MQNDNAERLEREAFEAWAAREGHDILRAPAWKNTDYHSLPCEDAWRGWQAAWRGWQAASPAAPPNPTCSVFEDMLRTLEYTESVYRLNVVKDNEPSSTLGNLQRVIARANSASPAPASGALLEYVLQDDLHNRLTPRVIDIAYTAFMQAKEPNAEDGGPSDWFNDTRPIVKEAIAKLRKDLLGEGSKILAASQAEKGESQ